jgi:hypothetical protein
MVLLGVSAHVTFRTLVASTFSSFTVYGDTLLCRREEYGRRLVNLFRRSMVRDFTRAELGSKKVVYRLQGSPSHGWEIQNPVSSKQQQQ